MKSTAAGIAIILGAWLIANFILNTLADPTLINKGKPWYQIECRVGSLKDLTDATVPTVGGPGSGGGNNPQPVAPGQPGQPAICGANLNLCQGQAMSCSNSSCSQFVEYVNAYEGGAATASLLKAIMIKESSCNSNAQSSVGAAGLMQMLPSTANIYKNRCGITATIDEAWLKNNPKGSVCLASEYLRALSQGVCGSNPSNIAAGYNGGATACQQSISCSGTQTCGETTRKWECLYDDVSRTQCNTGYNETRDYATKVLYCMNNPGF